LIVRLGSFSRHLSKKDHEKITKVICVPEVGL
jgi:hypothetical protein